jgi:tRNA threonylcarbamoyladenosine biosynthesis protein TsaE
VATTCSVASRSREQTLRLGEALGALLVPGDVLALEGPLGAGKTTLVQGIARGLGIPPEVPVTSPTFTLVGEYPGRVPLRHADFYRVESSARLADLGFDDLLDGEGVLVVEWPERFAHVLPRDRLWIRLEIRGESERLLRFEGTGERARALVGALSAHGAAREEAWD